MDRDVAEYWQTAFNRAGYTYTAPGEVIFGRPVGTRCGPEEPNRSSFYCPTTVYLDLPYEAGLLKHFVGDAAVAISVAHENGHHIQNLLGITKSEGGIRSHEYELQADCLAGVWSFRSTGGDCSNVAMWRRAIQ